jgi:hypothetical protein
VGIFYEFLIVESIFLDLFNQIDRTRSDPTAPASRPSQFGSVGRPPGAAARHLRPRSLPPVSAAARHPRPVVSPRQTSRTHPPPSPSLVPISAALCSSPPPRAASSSNFAAAAPWATKLRLRDLHDQANLPATSVSVDDACFSPPSSASVTTTPRARRRCMGNGGTQTTHCRVHLFAAEPTIPPRAAVVDEIAGGLVGRGGERGSNQIGLSLIKLVRVRFVWSGLFEPKSIRFEFIPSRCTYLNLNSSY